MIKKLMEGENLKFKSLSAEEKSKRGILGRLYGPVASFASPTRNNRKYTQELWEKLFNSDLIKERFENGGIFGELCHPDYEEVDMSRIAVIMPEPPMKNDDGQLIAYLDIIDTPCGKIAYQLAKYGYKFGISSRGSGDLIEGAEGEEVDPDTYQLNAFDLVEIPAVESARLSFTEALDKKRYNKTLRQTLSETLEKASEDDKKIMCEALESLNIKLEESLEEDWNAKLEELVNATESLVEEVEEGGGMADLVAAYQNLPPLPEDLGEAAVPHSNTPESAADKLASALGGDVIEAYEEEDDNGDREFIIGIKVPAGSNVDEVAEKMFGNEIYFQHTDSFKNEDGTTDEYFSIGFEREEVEEECNTNEECADKEPIKEEDEVADSKSDEPSAELVEALIRIKMLEKSNRAVKEQMSVRNAREDSLMNEVARYKEALAAASDMAKGLRASKQEAAKLRESLSAAKQALRAKADELNESIKEANDAHHIIEELTSKIDQVCEINESLESQVESQSKQLKESMRTAESYKRAFRDAKDRYIGAKAEAIGVSKEEIKGGLKESYSLSDVDSACNKLRERQRKINSLPFKIGNDTKVSIKSPREKITESLHDDDDDLSSLKTFLGMYR